MVPLDAGLSPTQSFKGPGPARHHGSLGQQEPMALQLPQRPADASLFPLAGEADKQQMDAELEGDDGHLASICPRELDLLVTPTSVRARPGLGQRRGEGEEASGWWGWCIPEAPPISGASCAPSHGPDSGQDLRGHDDHGVLPAEQARPRSCRPCEEQVWLLTP